MMEFFGWLETPATAAGPVVNHTRFCRWGCFHQAGFAHSACGARFKSPTRIEVCRFLSESLIKTRPYEKTTANVVTDGWMMKLQTEQVGGDPKINRDLSPITRCSVIRPGLQGCASPRTIPAPPLLAPRG